MSVELPRLINVRPTDDLDAHGVYRLFNADGVLLYVGQTVNLEARIAHHRSIQPWWDEVDSMEWIPVAGRIEALELERDSIQRDAPRHNKAGRNAITARNTLPEGIRSRLGELLTDEASNPELDTYMRALRDAGWPLTSIAIEVGLTRERVRQRVEAATPDTTIRVPQWQPKPRHTPKVWPTITDDERAELSALHPLATRCRGSHAVGSPERVATERLSELIAELRIRGVRVREIAEALGVTESAIALRLANHGYTKRPPSQPAYIGEPTRAMSDECHRGHPLSGDNLRLINGDPKRRACRACAHEAAQRYRERRRLAA